MKKRFVAFLLVLIMVLGMLPVSAFAADDGVSPQALNTGHKIDVTFTVLYVGDEFRIGYNYGTSENTQFVCQYSTNHSDTAYNNHTIAISDIKAAADRATVNSGYQIVGWSKEANANPKTWGFDLKDPTACNKGTTIYLVAKNPNPNPTYMYYLYYKYNDGTNSTWLTEVPDRPTTATTFTFHVNTAKLKDRRGYEHIGWADKADAAAAKYTGGEPITLTKDDPAKTIYAVWMPFFELRYDANGGTGAPDSQTRTASHPTVNQVTFTVPNQTPTKEGYTFKGWADSATATDAQYQPGGTVAVKHADSPKTVYAVWEESAPQPPLIPVPSYDDLKSAIGKIQVKDVSTPGCGTENYDLIDNTQSEPFNWTKTARLDQPGKYDVTIKTAPYVAKYNSEKTKTHELNNANQTTLRLVISYENSKWVLDDGLRVIEVKHSEQNPPTDIPNPNPGNIAESLKVKVVCTTTNSGHDPAFYSLIDGTFTHTDVDQSGDYPTCSITISPDKYISRYSTDKNCQHTTPDDPKTVPLFWNKEAQKWAVNDDQIGLNGVVFNAVCEAVPDTFTVTYTDGVENEEVFADQVYSDLRKDSTTPAFNGTPTRTGYTFAGWDPEVTETVTETVTYVAKWTPVEPKAPTADELKKLEMAVQVKCVVDASQQHTAAYDLLGEYDEDYFVGEPRKDGDDWLCDINYYPERYVAEFNTTFQNLKHVQNDEKIVPVTLIWAGDSWQIKEQGRVHVTEEYTVTFNAYGGFPTPDEQHVKSGEKAVLPVEPTLKGYTFAFWYLGEDEQNATAYDFDTPVTENITLTAKWNINKYTVTFNSYGGTPVPPVQEVEYGLTATKPADPTLKGYTFAFWYLGEDEQNATAYDFDTPVTENITLTAKWNINKYTVTFNTDGGTPVPPAQEVEYGLTATEPAAPEKTGYTFDGWYLDEAEEPFDFDTIITSDITLTAKWHVTPHNIYAYARLNSYFAPLTTSEFDTPVTLNEATLSRLGLGSYNSLGYISIGSFTFDAMPLTSDLYFADDAELSAVAEKLATDIALETGVSDKIAEKIAWMALYKTVNEEDMAPGYPAEAGYQLSGNLNLASVTFRAGAENVENMPAVNYTYDDGAIDFYDFYFAGDTITLPADPTREGYIFEGWSVKVLPAENDADHLDADGADDAADETLLKAGDTYTITAGGVIFTAQWEARTDTPYTVEHYLENLDGSYALDTTEPLKGTTDTTVTAAAKSYDNFTYDSTVPGTVASGNIAGDGSLVLKLFYTRNTYDYTVRHIKQLPDGTYDEANAEVETLSGKFEALAAVTAKDYGSHYPTNDADTKQNIKIEKGLTIDVKYDLDNHTLTFETNGGSAIDPVTVRHGNAVARPADPTKDKYTFIGWYVDPEFTEEYDFATVLEADKTIYAKFELTSTPIGDIYVRYDVLHIKQLPDGTYDLANAEVEHLSAKKDTTVTAVVKDYRATHHINVNSTLSKLTDTAIQPYPGADGKPVYTILSVYYDLDFHTLTFDTMGGSRIDPVTVRHGNAVAKPKDPVNGGYIFDGWYTDKTYRTPYNFATVLTQDTTIYAKWFLIALPGVTIKKATPKLNTSDHFAYVQGYPDGTVKPTGNITRAETAAILFRLMDEGSRKTYYSTKSGFRDVATGSWYNTYVATLNNAGVITDSSNGYFRPNEAITRAELAAMLANFTETAGAANYFNDVSARYWAANAIAICAKLGWITGYPDGSFRPDRNVTRAELMAMINRATGRAPKSTDAFLPGMKTWSDNTADKWYYLDVQEATNSHSYTVKDSEKWTALNADPNWSLYE